MQKIQMSKITNLKMKNLLFPMLPVLVGTTIDGKANYITIGMVGWLCYDTISIGVAHYQYSNKGIQQNRTFSINQPTVSIVKQLDYCGIVSGAKVDKSKMFENFYGTLETAPMIKECPVNMECRVIETIDRPDHKVYIGEIEEVYLNMNCIVDGMMDLAKIDPIFFIPGRTDGNPYGYYWKIGEKIAEAKKIGKDLLTK